MWLRRGVPGKDSRIQLLAGLAPSSQVVGSLLRTPWLQSQAERFGKKSFGKFTSNKKMDLTKSDKMNVASVGRDCLTMTL